MDAFHLQNVGLSALSVGAVHVAMMGKMGSPAQIAAPPKHPATAGAGGTLMAGVGSGAGRQSNSAFRWRNGVTKQVQMNQELNAGSLQ